MSIWVTIATSNSPCVYLASSYSFLHHAWSPFSILGFWNRDSQLPPTVQETHRALLTLPLSFAHRLLWSLSCFLPISRILLFFFALTGSLRSRLSSFPLTMAMDSYQVSLLPFISFKSISYTPIVPPPNIKMTVLVICCYVNKHEALEIENEIYYLSNSVS